MRRGNRAPLLVVAIAILVGLSAGSARADEVGVRFINQQTPFGGVLPECADAGVDVGNNGATGTTYATYSFGGACNNWNPRPAQWLRVRVRIYNSGMLLFTSTWALNAANAVLVARSVSWTGHTHGESESGYWWTFGPGTAGYRTGFATANI